MNRAIKSITFLLAVGVASCATSGNRIEEFLADQRGKVVGWQFQGVTYAYDYIEPTGNRFITKTIGASCDTGTFEIEDDEICYYVDPSAQSPQGGTYCYEVIPKKNGNYKLKSTRSSDASGSNIGVGLVISSALTNLKTLECN